MSDNREGRRVGIAQFFESHQLGSYFIKYVYLLFFLEAFIFLAAFLGNLGPDKGPFPWKFYFIVSFAAPIGITFLLGVSVAAFNHYIFDKDDGPETPAGADEPGPKKNRITFRHALFSLRRAPFLAILFFILIGSILFYHSGVIYVYLANAGEKAVRYLLAALGAALFLGAGVAVAWIIASYKLKKRHLDHAYEYKKEVMKTMGLLIMEDNQILDSHGNLIAPKQPKLVAMDPGDSRYGTISPNKRQIAS
ncbi:MAG: hypothetical protein ACOZF0_21935 [Thermodesulfobacteriota bacterium]